jgi:hypothetical protein
MLTYMFPDQSFDSASFKPLTYYSLIHNVLLPEAVVFLIRDDIPHLSRNDAIKTMTGSMHFGNVLHYNEDSPAVQDVTKKIAGVMACNLALYDEYEASKSLLAPLIKWGIKQEPVEPNFRIATPSDVIDLTIDD